MRILVVNLIIILVVSYEIILTTCGNQWEIYVICGYEFQVRGFLLEFSNIGIWSVLCVEMMMMMIVCLDKSVVLLNHLL